ncbi:permease prefix domain 1-containing protein [Promicromonospora kroppenstedtii]|uniref:Permease prefix domain 1-containing protein n=1 Tax=Promicromonospora kroppenstedtii TaxID=440482 RepID=A0ABW7XS49_9MICO
MNTSVHRLLDEAFAGLPATDDVQDLKEEIRANLLDRVAELTASGVDGDAAARRAVDELGDVRALVDGADVAAEVPAAPSPGVASAAAAAAGRPPVLPRRRDVAGLVVAIGVVLLALAPLVMIGGFVVDAFGSHRLDHLGPALPFQLVGPLLIGPVVGWIVGAVLVRETATRYGMPLRRAVAYGIASALLVLGMVGGIEAGVLFERARVTVQTAVPLLVAGGAWLAYLLASQTNRRKPWVLEQARSDGGYRPSRRYVTGVVIASAVVLSPFVGVLIALAGNIYGMVPLLVGALLAGPAIGWIVGATLVRETRTRYGMPRQRAIAYGFASALVALSVFVGTTGYTSSMNPFYAMMMLPVLLVGGAWLAYLLASQTNRRKPWVLERARERAGSRASGPGDSRPGLP